jgi:hypothetical protein
VATQSYQPDTEVGQVTEPADLSLDAIRNYAEKIGDHHGIYSAEGFADVDALVNKLGGRVNFNDSKESLHVNGVGDFTISLPRMTSARRDRFTLAHELGHYFLHYRYAKRRGVASFGRGARNLVETQANVFASSLLMPEVDFRQAFAQCHGDMWELSRIFDVSPAAAEVRAQVLRLS